ncbi:hypothetical protein C4D60_Mb04t05940 [Musa balbisiana]|uniref:Uncharacterized protein n=1 Tax=Musa balbisiana TaxID=52838 RepID=A0A4S8K9Z7_MUSBA|nr:hypothetical protein C4D60_Mb04t05940 [Musa balbisiana]
MANSSGRPEPEVLSPESTDSMRAQLCFLIQRLNEVEEEFHNSKGDRREDTLREDLRCCPDTRSGDLWSSRSDPHGDADCVVLLGSSAACLPETTPARPARLRRAPRLLGCVPPRDHTCAASPPASCSSAPRLRASPRPHLRGQPACVVLLGYMLPETTPARPARLRRAPRLLGCVPPRDHTCAASPPASCSSAPRLRASPRPHLRGQPACVVLLGYMLPETTPARPARLRRAPRLLGCVPPRDHTCAASPPASCSSATCCPRPRLRGLPACVVLLGSSAACLPETTPARPARLRRAPRLLGCVPPRDHTCAASPPASCSSATCCPRPRLRGLPACVVLLGYMLPETTPARPARLRRAPRLLGCVPPRDHTCAASPPASCSSAPRLRASPRPHLRGQPACVVLLGYMLPETTPARPARLRRAPRLLGCVPPRDHTCAASPPASCSSATCCPRPRLRGLPACVVFLGSMAFETHLRGLPACVVFLGSMAFETHLRGLPACVVLLGSLAPWLLGSLAPRPPRPHLRGQPACVVLLGYMLPETTPARPARLRRAPRLRASPRPHLRGQPACVVLLGYMLPETTPARPARLRRAPWLLGSTPPETTPARPARLRRAPRLHVARDHACAACPPAPCSSIARCRDHACAACPPASCSSAPRPPRPHLRASPPASCSSAPRLRASPRPHLRGQPACVVLLGSSAACLPETTPARPARCVVLLGYMLPETTPARPARLRRVPRLHGLRDTPTRPARLRRAPRPHDPRDTCAASPPASCSSATCARDHAYAACPPAPCSSVARCRDHACAACPPASCSLAPWLHAPRDHTCAASPPASCSSAACLPETTPARPARLRRAPRLHVAPRPRLRGLPACVVFLGSMAFETHLRGLPAWVVLLDPMTRDTPARPARLRRAPRLHVARDHACAACPPAPCSSIARCPRPGLRGLPACVVLLGSSAPRPPETTPARPARLRRAPRLHAPRDHTCAASPPASCSSAPCSPRSRPRGQPT